MHAINMIDCNNHRKLRNSRLRPSIMRQSWTQPKIPQLSFAARCIIRQPPASSFIPSLFFKHLKAMGSLIIRRFLKLPAKRRTLLELLSNSEKAKDTGLLRDSCKDVWRSNFWPPIDASIGSNQVNADGELTSG